jgi:CDGSH-type Zn-finger protein
MQINKAENRPALFELEKVKTYAWFSFGYSTNQPWCYGSHKGNEFKQHVFQTEESKTSDLCLFKGAENSEFCYGSHSK